MLNDTDIKNLLIFLSRVQVSGAEAPTFVELLQKVSKLAEPVKPPDVVPTPGKIK